MRKKTYFRLTLVISGSLSYVLAPLACVPTKVKVYPRGTRTEKTSLERPISGKLYTEVISQWKSDQDLVKWMERDFSFDAERYKRFEGTLPVSRTPEETFQLKSGIYIDAVELSKRSLNRINPPYKAKTAVVMVRPSVFNHYVCAFKKDGKLFVLDYGTPYKEITGVHGPYNSLGEYKKFYEEASPRKKTCGRDWILTMRRQRNYLG